MDKIITPRLIAVGLGLIRFPIAILALGGSYYGFANGHDTLAFVGALTCALGVAPLKKLNAPFGEMTRMPALLCLFLVTLHLAG